MAITTSSAKAKGKARVCRRCRQDYEPTKALQKVCEVCRKSCSSCSVVLTNDNWDTRGKTKGTVFRCRSCVAASVRNTPNRKEWQKEYDLKRNYDITLGQYKEMSLHGCSICSSKENLVVDHCHTSLVVRGVLCASCNKGLGMFQDDIERMGKAIGYLNSKRES